MPEFPMDFIDSLFKDGHAAGWLVGGVRNGPCRYRAWMRKDGDYYGVYDLYDFSTGRCVKTGLSLAMLQNIHTQIMSGVAALNGGTVIFPEPELPWFGVIG